MTTTTNVGIRDVTEDEIRHYREHGWVKLDALLDAATVDELYRRCAGLMGIDAETAKHPSAVHANGRGDMWNSFARPSAEDPFVHDLVYSSALGSLGWKFSGRPVRYWIDQLLVKLPVSTGHGAGHTPWHLDLPGLPHDRPGQMQVWIALRDVPPERGSLRFWDRSHGDAVVRSERRDVDLRAEPDALSGAGAQELNKLGLENSYTKLDDAGQLSPAFHLKAGDATVHHTNIVHSAPENRTDEPRWGYTISLLPADVCYTGDPHWIIEGVDGLQPGMPFNVPEFPVLPTPAAAGS